MRIDFEDPEALDQFPFAAAALGSLGYGESSSSSDGSRVLLSALDGSRLEFLNGSIRADAESSWQTVAAALAVHRVIRLQRSSLFFHAAAVGIRDAGILLSGTKCAGKTTLSLALADSGHCFLGDEISAVRTDSLELIPFRRRLSIRPGPAGPSVSRALERGGLPVVVLDDGTTRSRLHFSALHPGAPAAPVPLKAIVVMRSRRPRARIEPFTPRLTDIGSLVPFESATWGSDPRRIAMQVLSLMGRVPCYNLDPGPIPDTVRLLETLPE